MNEQQVNKNKRLRGAVLQFVQTNHADQGSHMDDLEIWGMMQDLNFGIGQNQVLTLLQDLCSRGYLKYEEQMNRLTGRCVISRIELTAEGRNLVERIKVDPAVLIP